MLVTDLYGIYVGIVSSEKFHKESVDDEVQRSYVRFYYGSRQGGNALDVNQLYNATSD